MALSSGCPVAGGPVGGVALACLVTRAMFAVLPAAGKAAAALVVAADVASRLQRSVPAWTIGSDAEQVVEAVRKVAGDASFWPTPWLGGLFSGHLQTIWYGLNIFSPQIAHREDVWRTADGGTLALAWPDVPASVAADAPIVLILPGLCGSIAGTAHTLRAMISQGLRPVVLHARGCGRPLTSPRFSLFGSTEDLREALMRILTQRPGARLLLHSISAGTALMVRYLGEEGAATPVVAAFANCPGYDISVCLSRCGALYDSAFYIGVLKRHWLRGQNGAVLRRAAPEVCRRMEESRNMHSFMVAASPFAAAPEAPPKEGRGSPASVIGRGIGSVHPAAARTEARPRAQTWSPGSSRAAARPSDASSGVLEADASTVANAIAAYLGQISPRSSPDLLRSPHRRLQPT